MDKIKGSKIAKAGFANEVEAVSKFNEWECDSDAQNWLQIMGYNLTKIKSVNAKVIPRQKADVEVEITSKFDNNKEYIQVKLVSNKRGYNQVDKRWVSDYAKLLGIPSDIENTLKRFTGEIEPNIDNPRDPRRMFIDEFDQNERYWLKVWLEQHRIDVMKLILQGDGEIKPNWLLISNQVEDNTKWELVSMNDAIKFYSEYCTYSIKETKKGNLKIGKVTMQRKGGDAGRKTANMLQFKLDPMEIFNRDKVGIPDLSRYICIHWDDMNDPYEFINIDTGKIFIVSRKEILKEQFRYIHDNCYQYLYIWDCYGCGYYEKIDKIFEALANIVKNNKNASFAINLKGNYPIYKYRDKEGIERKIWIPVVLNSVAYDMYTKYFEGHVLGSSEFYELSEKELDNIENIKITKENFYSIVKSLEKKYTQFGVFPLDIENKKLYGFDVKLLEEPEHGFVIKIGHDNTIYKSEEKAREAYNKMFTEGDTSYFSLDEIYMILGRKSHSEVGKDIFIKKV